MANDLFRDNPAAQSGPKKESAEGSSIWREVECDCSYCQVWGNSARRQAADVEFSYPSYNEYQASEGYAEPFDGLTIDGEATAVPASLPAPKPR